MSTPTTSIHTEFHTFVLRNVMRQATDLPWRWSKTKSYQAVLYCINIVFSFVQETCAFILHAHFHPHILHFCIPIKHMPFYF